VFCLSHLLKENDMKASVWFGFLLSVLVPVHLAGCTGDSGTTPKGQAEKGEPEHKDHDAKDQANGHDHGGHAADEADIKAERAKLSPEDQRLVAEQEFCAVMDDHRLGSMGTPVKVLLNDKAVFVCCKQCEKKALANPDKTLAKTDELKAKVKAGAANP
jgi:hypothetical protein